MRAGIFRVKWCVDQWFPCGISRRGVVSFDVSIANRGDRAPEIESVLCFEDRDIGIGYGHLHQSKQTRILAQASPRRAGELPHDGIKTLRAGDCPETRHLGLVAGAP